MNKKSIFIAFLLFLLQLIGINGLLKPLGSFITGYLRATTPIGKVNFVDFTSSLRNFVSFNAKNYVADTQNNRILVFHTSWRLERTIPFTSPFYIQSVADGKRFLITTAQDLRLTDLNFNVITTYVAPTEPGGYRSSYYDELNKEIFVVNYVGERVDTFDIDLNLELSVNLPARPHGIIGYKNKLFISTNQSSIIVVDNNGITATLTTQCLPGDQILQLAIDLNGVFAVPCYFSNKITFQTESGFPVGSPQNIPAPLFVDYDAIGNLVTMNDTHINVIDAECRTELSLLYDFTAAKRLSSVKYMVSPTQSYTQRSVFSNAASELRNFEIHNSQYYVPDAGSGMIRIFDKDWILVSTIPLTAPFYIKKGDNSFYISTEGGIIKTDLNVNVLQATYIAPSNSNRYRSIYYDDSNGRVYAVNVEGNRLDTFDQNLLFLSSINLSTTVHGIVKYIDKFYISTLSGSILVVSGGAIVQTIQSPCDPGDVIYQVTIDKYGLIAVPCFFTGKVFLLNIDGTSTGLPPLIIPKPLFVNYDENQNLAVVTETSVVTINIDCIRDQSLVDAVARLQYLQVKKVLNFPGSDLRKFLISALNIYVPDSARGRMSLFSRNWDLIYNQTFNNVLYLEKAPFRFYIATTTGGLLMGDGSFNIRASYGGGSPVTDYRGVWYDFVTDEILAVDYTGKRLDIFDQNLVPVGPSITFPKSPNGISYSYFNKKNYVSAGSDIIVLNNRTIEATITTQCNPDDTIMVPTIDNRYGDILVPCYNTGKVTALTSDGKPIPVSFPFPNPVYVGFDLIGNLCIMVKDAIYLLA